MDPSPGNVAPPGPTRPANGAPPPSQTQTQMQSQPQSQQQQNLPPPQPSQSVPTMMGQGGNSNAVPPGQNPFQSNASPNPGSSSNSNGNLNAEAGPGPRTSVGQAGPSATVTLAQRREEERRKDVKDRKRREREEVLVKKDKSLGEMLVMLEDYQPLIPDEVTDYYLQRSGFECDDPRIKRLLSLAAQKFVNDIASDAFHYAKLRMNAPSAKTGKAGSKGNEKDKSKVVLTMDDLTNALGEHGVNARKPDYYF